MVKHSRQMICDMSDQVASKHAFLEERYRRRMAEILAMVEQQRAAVESLLTEEDQYT